MLRQEQLSERFGVSRTPIREALRRLAAHGLVSFTPNRGVRVRTLSRDELREAFLVRAELESLATELAVPRMTPQRLADLDAAEQRFSELTVALRKHGVRDEFMVLATELSPEALDLARENAVGHATADSVRFLEADLLPPVIETPFDLILANLPYVRSDVVPTLPVAASFEPRMALDGGPDGLTVIRQLLERLRAGALAEDGEAMLEIGADQERAISEAVAEVLPGWSCRVEPDLAGLPRVARIAPPAVHAG